MATTQRARQAELIEKYPAIKNQAQYRPSDGLPIRIHVRIERADEAFLGFCPIALVGPNRYLRDEKGGIGLLRQEVYSVAPGNTIIEDLRPGQKRTVRDFFTARPPFLIDYLFVVSNITWHATTLWNGAGEMAGPYGAVVRHEREIVIRTPPKKDVGFAGLLNRISITNPEVFYHVPDLWTFREKEPTEAAPLRKKADVWNATINDRWDEAEAAVKEFQEVGVGTCSGVDVREERAGDRIALHLFLGDTRLCFVWTCRGLQLESLSGSIANIDWLVHTFVKKWKPVSMPRD